MYFLNFKYKHFKLYKTEHGGIDMVYDVHILFTEFTETYVTSR